MKLSKKIVVVISIFIAIIAAFNIAWLVNNYVFYAKYRDAVGYREAQETYSTIKDGYTYHVGDICYPTFTNNLAITRNRERNADGTPAITECTDILIWPKGFGKYEVGITFATVDMEKSTSEDWVETGYNLLLNEKMELIENAFRNGKLQVNEDVYGSAEEALQEARQYYNEHIEEIAECYQRIYDMWGICKPADISDGLASEPAPMLKGN